MKHSPFQHDAPRMPASRRTPAAPRGFTLVELLMVVVIIGILSALIITASMSLLGTSREAATKATLSKVNTLLKQRMSAFEIQLSNDYTRGVHKTDPDFPSVNSLPEQDKKVFYRKKLFKKYFPQTWAEAREIAEEAGVLKPGDPLPTASDSASQASESAEVLYMFLTKTSLTGQGEVGQDAFLQSELADKDQEQDINPMYPERRHKELVDSWGNPLRFYRWPCRLIKPSAVGPTYAQPLNGTPPNPAIAAAENAAARTQIPALTKTTTDTALNSDPDNTLNLDLAGSISNYLNDFHIPRTYHTPLIVSAGVDGLFGLESPTDTTSTNAVDHRQAKPEYQTFIDGYPMPPPPEPEIEEKRRPLYDNLTNLNALAGGTQ